VISVTIIVMTALERRVGPPNGTARSRRRLVPGRQYSSAALGIVSLST